MSDKQKTALVQAIEHFENAERNDKSGTSIIWKGIADQLRQYLPKEREQIGAAWSDGFESAHDPTVTIVDEQYSAESYFTNTYQQQ